MTAFWLAFVYGLIASVWDCSERRIPVVWPLLMCGSCAWLGPMWGWIAWHPESIILAFIVMALLPHPGGDRNMAAALCGVLSLVAALQVLIGIVIVEVLLLETVGRERSLEGAPFFPWCALVICARLLA